jgi:outer membrane receptor for ferrienterochelin and colicin
MRTSIDRSEVFAKVGLLDAFSSIEGSSVAVVANASWHDYSSFFGLRQYDGRQHSAQVRAVTALPFRDDFSMMAGLSWQFDDVAERIIDTSLIRWESVPGAFIEVTTKPFTGVTLIGGLRADQHNMFGTFVTPRVHAKWALSDYTTVRGSAGKGYRVPTLVAENISAFITSMPPIIEAGMQPEVSWNYGVSVTHVLEVFGRPVTLDAEIYHTEFENQLVVDFDAMPGSVQFRNLGDGRSFATAGMVQALVSVLPGLDVNIAYRRVDNRTTFGGKLMERPMFSRDRVLVTASWALPDDSWQIDATWSYNGGGRLPSTQHLTPEHRRGDTFPGFSRLNGQVQHRFSDFDVYVGIENATNFFQQDPIIAPERPFGPHFDAAMAWGPTDQRFVYLGFRFRVP